MSLNARGEAVVTHKGTGGAETKGRNIMNCKNQQNT